MAKTTDTDSKRQLLHGTRPCKTCPFREDLGDGFFDPETLDATIGRNLRGERDVHRCHNEPAGGQRQLLCVGFMRYLMATDTPNSNFRMGGRLGCIDPSVFDMSVPIVEDWDEVLENHAQAMAEAGS
jgi:hypothetical protein